MKAPIKERIVVLRYKRLEVKSYREICDAMRTFLSTTLAGERFVEEVRNSPEVTIPIPTVGTQEPDWSTLKVSIDRQSRFWNDRKTRCIQFFRDCLTFNCIASDATEAERYKDLKSFFETVLPFLRRYEKSFAIETVGIDYENRLTTNHLEPFLINGGRTLQICDLFRMFSLKGVEISDVEFVTPITQKITWASKPDVAPYAYRVTETIDMPMTREPGKWQVRVLLSAASDHFPGLSSVDVSSFLDCMHKAVRVGFRATFTENALPKIGVKDEWCI